MLATVARLDEVRFGPGGGVYKIVATGAQTGNAIFAFEAIEPPGGGPPLHSHCNEDEFFLVLEGEMTFWIDGRAIRATAGETAFVPRGVPHTFKNRSARESRVLVVFTPATIEGFFEYGRSEDGTSPSDEELIERFSKRAPTYGLEVLGPSPL